MTEVLEKAKAASAAATALAAADGATRNAALCRMADQLEVQTPAILKANSLDMEKAREDGTPGPLLDRLMLTEERIAAIAGALRTLAEEPDPVGEIVEGRRLYNDIRLSCVRVPIGVVAMIYEARPNVTADAAGLCIKTGNVCILRGGSMAVRSNLAISTILSNALTEVGLPAEAIQSIESTGHDATDELMSLSGLVDVLIPRGSARLIDYCVEKSAVPVIETGAGNCHVYIHEDADPDFIVPIVINAKTQRPGVCNAIESLLVDGSAAAELLPDVLTALVEHGVTIHADEHAASIAASHDIEVIPATEKDWGTEYLDLDISVKCVSGLDEAIAHINRYGTGHSECIITRNIDALTRFTDEVDAAAVYVNASTRFTDGAEFGLGAEIGISTQKLHARGPMGLRALTTTKYILMGDGQIRE